MRNTAVHQSDSIGWQNPKNCSDVDTRSLVWGKVTRGKGKIRIGDVRMWSLLASPRRFSGGKEGRRALGRDYRCNREKGANRNEDFPKIDFFLS